MAQTENADFTALLIGSLIRTATATAGGYLMAKGVDAETSTAVVGGLATLAAGGWSIWQKKRVVKTIKAPL